MRRGKGGGTGRDDDGWCWGEDIGESGATLREGGSGAGIDMREEGASVKRIFGGKYSLGADAKVADTGADEGRHDTERTRQLYT